MTGIKIKSIVSDMDGTLLDSQGCLSDITIDILNALHDRGINIIIATGRLYPDARRLLGVLNFTPAIISCNGAVLHDSKNSDLLASFYINKSIISELVRYSNTSTLHATLFSDNLWYVFKDNPNHKDYIYQSGLNVLKTDVSAISNLNINKVLFNSTPEFTSHHYNQLISFFKGKINICRTSSSDIEVMPRGINKYVTLNYYLNSLDLNSDSCLAFGDALNDLEMLSSVAEAVLMNNAKPDIVNLLPAIIRTDSNQDNGVAHYLAKRFNISLPINKEVT